MNLIDFDYFYCNFYLSNCMDFIELVKKSPYYGF